MPPPPQKSCLHHRKNHASTTLHHLHHRKNKGRTASILLLRGQNEICKIFPFARPINSLLNFGNVCNARNVLPHCPVFLHFFTIILHMSCFSVYFPYFFPTYVQHLPDLRSKFAKLIDISIFLKGSCPPYAPPYAPLYPCPSSPPLASMLRFVYEL